MRKLLILILLSLTIGLNGQMIGILSSQGGVASSVVFTDDFNSYANGSALANQGNWAATDIGSITCNGTGIYPGEALINLTRLDETIGNDQYAQLVVNAASSTRSLGIGVRMNLTSGGNGYIYDIDDGGARVLYELTNGTLNVIASCVGTETQHTIRIEVAGTEIRCYVDGNLDTALTGGTGIFTDASFSSGSICIFGYNASATRTGDNFEGGEL